MAQYFHGVIDPENTDGTELADMLSLTAAAILSTHSGTSAPTYAVAGALWLDTTTSTAWAMKLFDGSDWNTIYTINPATGTVSIAGLTVGAVGNSLMAAATRADALAALGIGGGELLAGVSGSGSVTTGNWIDEVIQTMTFTAKGYVTLLTVHGAMRHTGSAVLSQLRTRFYIPTTGQQPQNATAGQLDQHIYAPYAMIFPLGTTPGATYTVQQLFSNLNQNSFATCYGAMYAHAF